jgi:hypothetical protein
VVRARSDQLLVDFRQFLEKDCGSILQLLPNASQREGVQLIHEPFRSFLIDAESCPQVFYIDMALTHGYLTLKCLQRLKNGDGANDVFDIYAVEWWVCHLSKVTLAQPSTELLVAVYRFFTSEGLWIWVKWLCSWAISDGIRFPDTAYREDCPMGTFVVSRL